ncbi:hypothetical protein AIOL_003654 [Candidatus Rhodobacter oscarellae]|uniref:Dynamin N-terminal domain-containing protein n=1 Tax=Candidatus Rhodobacter oscarellae TaxID=1675527 RepID=A0A0J9E7D4_9RHOB|nr:dynamin family protein [Candidatus Rhodobacter lobularis]KMW58675.1 hypothetical protein AIOL_003654 [Candidatus Rhodobacter lobularis]
MNAKAKFEKPQPSVSRGYEKLVHDNFAPLDALRAQRDDLMSVLQTLRATGGAAIGAKAKTLQGKLTAAEPSITMIGQVKAGKTSLVNAMVGWPGLLPADVNPWTSVVTSLHLTPDTLIRDTQAEFRFFEKAEWDRLVTNGGRVGEIAGRAGSESEAEKVRQQVEAMQEKSRRRLGRKYELLLGQSHDYGTFDSSLIERYVCLGDAFDSQTDATRANGRFADITKSADLYLERPGLPMNLAIRDTPGVNDTFMVREQITIRAIRDSRICVVVLSAHQALSTVDMALIRLISNVDARQVVIFVNRIDELSDPGNQVPEIKASIERTLRDLNGTKDFEIVFGSAHWATAALQTDAVPLTQDAIASLKNWGTAHRGKFPGLTEHDKILWKLSGVPELFEAISRRIAAGPGQEALDQVARRAQNLAYELKSAMRAPTQSAPTEASISPDEAMAQLEKLRSDGGAVLQGVLDEHLADFETRMQSVHRNFLSRATAALVTHLDAHGEDVVWSYDPTGLRVLLRSAYQLFAKRAVQNAKEAFARAAQEATALCRNSGVARDAVFKITPPEPEKPAPPVILGQTIVLDLKSNWWSKWWRRRRGHSAFSDEFYELVKAESLPILEGLSREYAEPLRAALLTQFSEFLQEQHEALQRMARADPAMDPQRDTGQARQDQPRSTQDIDRSLEILSTMVA